LIKEREANVPQESHLMVPHIEGDGIFSACLRRCHDANQPLLVIKFSANTSNTPQRRDST